jgi:hypothetical protein
MLSELVICLLLNLVMKETVLTSSITLTFLFHFFIEVQFVFQVVPKETGTKTIRVTSQISLLSYFSSINASSYYFYCYVTVINQIITIYK